MKTDNPRQVGVTVFPESEMKVVDLRLGAHPTPEEPDPSSPVAKVDGSVIQGRIITIGNFSIR